MKYYSIIINSHNHDLSIDEVENIVKHKLNIEKDFDRFNKLIVDGRNKNSIGISELHNLFQWASSKTEYIKDIIIYSAEKMTEEAQNSLLKIVEEPPENVLIILLTNNKDSLLPTILSRCLLINSNDNSQFSRETVIMAERFLDATYLERVRLIDRMSIDDEMTREKINYFLTELLRILVTNEIDKDVTDAIKKIYKGMKRGSNIKVSLDYLNIILESSKLN